MASVPLINRQAHHSGALLDHLARNMRRRAEAVLAPLGLRPSHLVALTVAGSGALMMIDNAEIFIAGLTSGWRWAWK